MTSTLILAATELTATLVYLVVLAAVLRQATWATRLVVVLCLPVLTATIFLLALDPSLRHWAGVVVGLSPVWLGMRRMLRLVVGLERDRKTAFARPNSGVPQLVACESRS